jgi:hypothetical protein
MGGARSIINVFISGNFMVLNGKMPFIAQSALFDLVSRNPQKNSSAKINSHFNGPEQI